MADDYEVGYRKPPMHSQFTKGQSGNPKGRAKGTKNLKTDLMEELAEQILLREGNRPLKLSKQRAMVKSLIAKAIKGDTRAANLVLNIVWRVLEKEQGEDQTADLAAEDHAILDDWIRRNSDNGKGDEE